MKPPKPSHPIRLVRTGVAVAVLAAIGAGVAFGTDAGTLCAWCPLGFAQTSLASREFHAAVLAPLVAVIAAAALLGRAFCSWGCPSGLVKKRGASRARSSATKRGGQDSKGGCASQGKSCGASAAHPLPSIALIAAVLLASFIVGFPVFCLFCPIGLVFGLMFAIFRSLTVYQPSWDLVIFPLMLIIELRLFGSWCSRICPLGAAASLIARISPFKLKTKANLGTCRIDSSCHACSEACPESLEPPSIVVGSDETCTLCLECAQACPHRSLAVGISPRRAEKEERMTESTE